MNSGVNLNLTDIEVIDWMSRVRMALAVIRASFKHNEGLILTEGDLECILFSELVKEGDINGDPNIFNRYYESKNSTVTTRMVHSQVTWFKPLEHSGFRVDITIFNPSNALLKHQDDVAVWPNKGFFHDGKALGIEIKFIRTHVLSKIKETVKEDLDKIVNHLIPAKLENIRSQQYKNASANNIAFMIIIGCKDDSIYLEALQVVKTYIKQNKLSTVNYLQFHIFSPNDHQSLITPTV